MKELSGNGKNFSPVFQLEKIEKLSQSFIEYVKSIPGEAQSEKMLHLSMQFACIDFAELKKSCEKETEASDVPDSKIGELIAELHKKDQKIQEFKISLADSVMENKELRKEATESRESCKELKNQVTQMQLHAKEISLKLSSADTGLSAAQKELSSLKHEISELTTAKQSGDARIKELENELRHTIVELEKSQRAEENLSSRYNKSEQDMSHLKKSYDQLKIEIEAHEFRGKELESAIESLQREKNHLQSRLDKLLMGSKKITDYTPPGTIKSGSSVLEPSCISEYLPFCFPERLPAAIKFRQDIQQSWSRKIGRASQSRPVIFAGLRLFKPARHATRSVSFEFRLIKPSRTLHTLAVDTEKCFDNFTFNTRTCRESTKKDFAFAACFYPEDRAEHLVRPSHRALSLIDPFCRKHESIIPSSFELYMKYLEQCNVNLVLKRVFRLKFRFKPLPIELGNYNLMKTENYLVEKLAFRHRFQLQSQSIIAPETTFVCSFKKGNKLKSVLELFGKSISSMVEKYDIIATSPGRNGGVVK